MRVRILVAGSFALIALAASLLVSGRMAWAGGGCEGAPTTEASNGTVVHMAVCFTPAVLHVAPGATVTWINGDQGIVHTVTGVEGLWGSTGDIHTSEAVSFRFNTPGTYVYECIYHPGMVGAVVVGDGTGASGMLNGVEAVQDTPAAAATPAVSPAAGTGQSLRAAATPAPPSTLPATGGIASDRAFIALALAGLLLLVLAGLAQFWAERRTQRP